MVELLTGGLAAATDTVGVLVLAVLVVLVLLVLIVEATLTAALVLATGSDVDLRGCCCGTWTGGGLGTDVFFSGRRDVELDREEEEDLERLGSGFLDFFGAAAGVGGADVEGEGTSDFLSDVVDLPLPLPLPFASLGILKAFSTCLL